MSRMPGPPAGPSTPGPPRNPAPIPRPAPPPPPRPSRLRDDVWFRIGVAAGVVGALLLITHYFEPMLLLAALPTKKWREQASLALPHAPRHRRRPPSPASGTAASWSGVASAAVPSSSPSSRLRQNAATVG